MTEYSTESKEEKKANQARYNEQIMKTAAGQSQNINQVAQDELAKLREERQKAKESSSENDKGKKKAGNP